jgi:hypothetical protein
MSVPEHAPCRPGRGLVADMPLAGSENSRLVPSVVVEVGHDWSIARPTEPEPNDGATATSSRRRSRTRAAWPTRTWMASAPPTTSGSVPGRAASASVVCRSGPCAVSASSGVHFPQVLPVRARTVTVGGCAAEDHVTPIRLAPSSASSLVTTEPSAPAPVDSAAVSWTGTLRTCGATGSAATAGGGPEAPKIKGRPAAMARRPASVGMRRGIVARYGSLYPNDAAQL